MNQEATRSKRTSDATSMFAFAKPDDHHTGAFLNARKTGAAEGPSQLSSSSHPINEVFRQEEASSRSSEAIEERSSGRR